MAEADTTPKSTETPRVVGLLAEFDGPAALKAAAKRLRDEGFTRWDAHSPFPVHGMERAMGIRPTRLPWLVLLAGLTGAAVAIAMQWWTNAVDYPFVISGKPLFSLPANIPVAFEVIVLFSALAAFGGALALSRLPQFFHPAFTSERFLRVTADRFFISIEAADAKFDESATPRLVESLGATGVEVCRATSAGRDYPKAFVWIAIVVIGLAALPPLLIARTRAVKSRSPRIHIIQDMDFQPKYLPQARSLLFADGRTMRPRLRGTIVAGRPEDDDHFYRGKVNGEWATTFPMPVTQAMVERGQQRFNIYCAPCHGLVGEGGATGMVSIRALEREEPGWVPPLSLHSPVAVEQPVGQTFNTITHGIRTMPAYGSQIPVEDRWAIVLYERALQRSQHAAVDDVPEDVLPQLR